jgi:hypothetical protein
MVKWIGKIEFVRELADLGVAGIAITTTMILWPQHVDLTRSILAFTASGMSHFLNISPWPDCWTADSGRRIHLTRLGSGSSATN